MVILLMVMMLFQVFKQQDSGSASIGYSDFLSMVDSGNVIEVTIQGNNLLGMSSQGPFKTFAPEDPEMISLFILSWDGFLIFKNIHYDNYQVGKIYKNQQEIIHFQVSVNALKINHKQTNYNQKLTHFPEGVYFYFVQANEELAKGGNNK